MMKPIQRISAIAVKEWRLNARFLTEYLAANVISPIKTAVLMYCLYSGLLKGSGHSLGVVNQNNFPLYVLIGTTCHSLLMASVYIFRAKMSMEKWWQTITATLISPASTVEVVIGYIIGSGGINLIMGMTIYLLITYFFPVSSYVFFTSVLVLLLLALFGFGIGLLGATLTLCWEGKSFLFDYSMQGLMFLSCFYYPIDTLPSFLHPLIEALPTYHAAQLIHELHLYGHSSIAPFTLMYLGGFTIIALVIPAMIFEYSLKRYGTVGY